MVSPDKIAVCLSCGNEWEVRTAGTGKKRKCPVCGKYKVIMKSEVKDDANQNSHDPVDNSPGSAPDPATVQGSGVDRDPSDPAGEEMDGKRRRKGENSPTSLENSPGSSMSSPEEKSGEQEEEHSGGGIITYAALLLLAMGAGWFLVGLVRRRRAPPVDTGYDEVEQYNPRVPAFPGF